MSLRRTGDTATTPLPYKQETFTISYQKQEAEKVVEKEKELMNHFGYNKSQLHKTLVKDTYKQLRMP